MRDMKQATRDFLKQLADDKEAKIALEQQKPAVIEKAMKEYSALGTYLKKLVDGFNEDPEAKRSGITLRFDEPLQYNQSIYFAIRQLINGYAPPYPKGQVLLLIAPLSSDFDNLRLSVQTWQNNLTLQAIPTNLSGYAPGDEPKRLTRESYKLVVVDSTYGWVPDGTKPSQPLSTQGLFFDLVHNLIMSNARA